MKYNEMVICSGCGITGLDYEYGYWFCPKCTRIFQPKRVAMALLNSSYKELKLNSIRKDN